jgi:hypothetical protein
MMDGLDWAFAFNAAVMPTAKTSRRKGSKSFRYIGKFETAVRFDLDYTTFQSRHLGLPDVNSYAYLGAAL